MNLHEIYLASQIATRNNGGSANLSNYYTKSQTDARIIEKIAEIVSNAPKDFDTLKELSDWIANHENSAAAMNSAIAVNTSEVAKLIEQAALNRSTLGYQRKNLLLNNCRTTIKSGVTAAVNEDGSITLNGTSTSSSVVTIFVNMQTGSTSNTYANNKKWIPNGKYILSGSDPSSGVYVQVAFSNDNASETRYVSTSAGEPEFEVTDADKYVWARLRINANASFDNITVYPMIRPAEITDNTYELYKPSVEERLAALEEKFAAQEGDVT